MPDISTAIYVASEPDVEALRSIVKSRSKLDMRIASYPEAKIRVPLLERLGASLTQAPGTADLLVINLESTARMLSSDVQVGIPEAIGVLNTWDKRNVASAARVVIVDPGHYLKDSARKKYEVAGFTTVSTPQELADMLVSESKAVGRAARSSSPFDDSSRDVLDMPVPEPTPAREGAWRGEPDDQDDPFAEMFGFSDITDVSGTQTDMRDAHGEPGRTRHDGDQGPGHGRTRHQPPADVFLDLGISDMGGDGKPYGRDTGFELDAPDEKEDDPFSFLEDAPEPRKAPADDRPARTQDMTLDLGDAFDIPAPNRRAKRSHDDYGDYDPAPRKKRQSHAEEMLDGFSGALSDDDIDMLLDGATPDWDYSVMRDAAGSKRLFGSKSTGNDATTLNMSGYIADVSKAGFSYYDPDKCEIVTVFSPKGGVGKTTIADMLAIQLNFYFNYDLMIGRAEQHRIKILRISVGEFDDSSADDIGNSDPTNSRHIKHAADLLEQIKQCDGNPSWDEISEYFDYNRKNYVFKLRPMTLGETLRLGDGLNREEWRQIIDVCRRYFSYIVIDTGSTFAMERDGLTEMAIDASTVTCYVSEPDARCSILMYEFLRGISAGGKRLPLDPNKMLLVLNKVISRNNPWIGYAPEHPQIPTKRVAQSAATYFSRTVCIPMTQYTAEGNILMSNDTVIKDAAAELADTVLEMTDKLAKRYQFA